MQKWKYVTLQFNIQSVEELVQLQTDVHKMIASDSSTNIPKILFENFPIASVEEEVKRVEFRLAVLYLFFKNC